ncbi:MAG TPA: thermonuclease family protein [Nitrospirota bacterium]|nr:thermonuclease family protein [Nitrospirota bacterium]
MRQIAHFIPRFRARCFRGTGIALLAVFLLFPLPASSETVLHEAKVVAVVDGDTVKLLLNGEKRTSRLIGIDAPEMGQVPWGRKSREHLRALLKQSAWRVSVEMDVEQTDRFRRSLVYLWLQNGEMVNERMLLDGYAFRFTMKPNTRYSERFKKAQRTAREKKLGVWGPDGPKERPVDYKKDHPHK